MACPDGEARALPGNGARRFLHTPWAAALLGLLCFANSVTNDFVYDDNALVRDNTRIRDLRNQRAIWLSDWWYPREGSTEADPKRDRLYRPLTLFSFALNYAAHGLRPAGFHAVNIALHAVVCGLVWQLARRLTGDDASASVAGALFAVHPVHSEAVANVVGRAEVLAALFLLIGLLTLLPRAGLAAMRRGVAAMPAFLAALAAKETAICYPAVALLVLHFRTRQRGRASAGWWAAHAAFLLVPLILYLPVRYVVLEQRLFRTALPDALMNPVSQATGFERVLAPLTVLGHYLRLLIAPGKLSSDYGLAIVDPSAGFTLMTGLGVLAAGGLAAGLLALFRTGELARCVGVLTASFAASYALISNTVLLIGVSLAERLMYWPSVPALTLAAVGVLYAWRRWAAPGRPFAARAPLLRTLGVMLLAIFGLRTIVRNADWATIRGLLETDVATYPQGAHLNRGYALELMRIAETAQDPAVRREHFDLAEQYLAHSLTIDPAHVDALVLRARVRMKLGDAEQARVYAESALILEPNNRDALEIVHALQGRSADVEQRLAELRAAVAAEPDAAGPRAALGAALLEVGKVTEAREQLGRAAALDARNVDTWRRLGQAAVILDQKTDAIDAFRRVLTLNPSDWSTHTNLASLLVANDPSGALEHARRAYELQPTDLRVNVNLAEAYAANERMPEALKLYENIRRQCDPNDPFRAVVEERIRRLKSR